MSSSFIYTLLIIFVAPLFFYKTGADSISINLSSYTPQNKSTQIFSGLHEVQAGVIIDITVDNVPYNYIDFFIIQVHSFAHNTVLSYNKNFNINSSVNGTNLGLVQLVSNQNTYQFYLKNEQFNNTLYVVVIPYNQAPIPGGCNMEFNTEIAPYQHLKYTDSLIVVDAQSASMIGHRCDSQIVRHEMYQMYLPETDFSKDTYFKGIVQMLTVENIRSYGTQVSKPVVGFLREWFNTYIGTGSIYVIIATFNNTRSAYVPIVTYGCDINNAAESCDSLNFIVSKLICSVIVFLGLFTCYFGHKYFKTEMFCVGSLVGAYVTYLLMTFMTDFNEKEMIVLSTGIGIVFGLIWLGFWWYFGIPILSSLLPIFLLGFLIASTVFYAELSDLTIVNNNITYWGFFISIVLFCMTIFTGFMDKANILACGIVGSYAFIIPLDHYLGSNLKYIFINTYRRITVDYYEKAVINAPFQTKDLFLTILWLLLATTGVLYQWRRHEGRPPFPPGAAKLQQPPNERTPLLIPTSSVGASSDRIILIHSTPADV